MSARFDKTSIGWQLMQWQQQFWEWLELQFFQNNLDFPKVKLPSGLSEVLWPLLKILSWLLLVVAIFWVSWQLWLILRPYLYGLSFEWGTSANTGTAQSETVRDLWERSQKFYRQGNYKQAARYLYLAMLQKLHDSGLVPQQPSRTDGEYRQLTDSLPKREAYQMLLNTHENIYFGNADISPEDFQQCQQAYREIEEKRE